MRAGTTERGGVVIEFTLVLPLFLAMIGLGLALGTHFAISGLLEHAAERAAQKVAATRGAVSVTPASAAFVITPSSASLTPPSPAEGETFEVTLGLDWDNPAWRLVRLLTGGEAGPTALSASATGVREWNE
jgi:hypothetical protein